MSKPTVTLVLPPEFLALCKRDNVKPSEVLRGFIADLCGIQNWASNPRSDGYCSNGSDERMYAEMYYERCGYRFAREFDEETKRRQEGQP